MSDQISYNVRQLEQFRTSSGSEAGRIGALGDGLTTTVSSSDFGLNEQAGAISSAIEGMMSHLRTEFSKAETLLRDVSRSIDSVQTAVEEADKDGKLLFATKGDTTAPQSAGGGSSSGGGGGGGGGGSSTGGASADPNAGTAPAVTFGTGVKVKLPGGQTVDAPNEKAAGAVREALTQLGVPYVWADATPGKGFDCSGLTMWAYGKEGVKLPHYAASQDIGERVSEQNLAPGDLVVWDGHVAMFIGDGKVIEAPQTGETVHIVPLYTHNGSDRFEGFFRPTA
jgi:peptidoglycan DL-endopeptidase CwlO